MFNPIVRRALWSWAHVWRYTPVTHLPPQSLTKTVGETRTFVFDFTAAPEYAAIASATVTADAGLTVGTPEKGTFLPTYPEGTARPGKQVAVRISGGAADTVYAISCAATLINNSVLTIPALLAVVADKPTVPADE